MKGYLFKYEADTEDPELAERGHLRDPDFRIHEFPVWAICARWLRTRLERDDVVFFISQKWTLANDVLDYIFTGMLVVDERVETPETALREHLLHLAYVKL